jgi:membrane protein
MPAAAPTSAPAEGKPGLIGFVKRIHHRHAATVNLFRNSAAEAQKSRLPQMAAALAYRTVFGLIPVFVVSLVAIRVFFASNDKLADLVTQLLNYSGLSSISVQEQGPPAPDAAAGAGGAVGSAGNAHLDQWIKELVEKVGGINFAAVGWVSLAALLYAAISMLVEIERAFNQVYRVPAGRSWVRRVTQYWTLLTLGTLGLACTFVVGEKFTTWLHATAVWNGKSNTIFLGLAGYITTVSISTALFLLAYTVVPNTRVKIGPALAGAAVAACLWEGGKWGLSQYIRYSAGYSRLYGSLALVPLFLMWVYITWVIVLFGLNFAYYLQYGRHHTKAQPNEMLAPVIIDPASTLALMAAMARRFESGQASDPKTLAAEIGVQEPITRQMLERLSASGLILTVKTDEETGARYSLARPPSRIDAAEVLRVGEELSGGVRPDPVSQTMRQARFERVNGRTLESFLANSPTPPRSGNGSLANHAPAAVPPPAPVPLET